MLVRWSLHAEHQFAERAAKLGLNYGDIEIELKKQKVKVRIEKNKFKTIFKIFDDIITVVKVETDKFIHVVTLWEANEKEVEIWKKK